MHDPVAQVGGWLKSVLNGYYQYHAVPGNLTVLMRFRRQVAATGPCAGTAQPKAAQLGKAGETIRSNGYPHHTLFMNFQTRDSTPNRHVAAYPK